MKKKITSKPSRPVSKPQDNIKIKPFGDRILVKPFTEEALRKAEGKASFGIILPDSMTKEKAAQGKVLAVGEGRYDNGVLVPMRIKVGDTVVFSKYGYDEVEQGGEEYYLVKEESLLAIRKN